jgi:hypothetical protein
MGTYGAALGLGLITVLSAIGCGSGDDGADTGSADLTASAGNDIIWDHDLQIPPMSVPLSHTFTESLSKFGITVTPSLTASGTFGLKNSDVHLQVAYKANPPKIDRLDLFSRGTWTASARLDLDVKAGAGWSKSADIRKSFSTGTSLGGKAWEILKTPLAIMPLPQAPNVQLELDLELAASCELDFDSELHAFAEVGVEGLATADVFYNPAVKNQVGFVADGGLSTADMFHVTIPPHMAFKDGNLAQLHGKCGLQPSLNLSAALVVDPTHPLADAGVKFIVEPYAEFTGKFNSLSDWSVDTKVALQGSIAPFGDFFGRPFQTTMNVPLFQFDLARGPTTSADPGTDTVPAPTTDDAPTSQGQ